MSTIATVERHRLARPSSRTASTVRTAEDAAAIAARLTEPRQVGGLLRRSSRRSCADLLRACACASAAGPVRPRASTVPAWVPRCLRRRLRLVWAMGRRCARASVTRSRSGAGRGRSRAGGHVVGEALERGARARGPRARPRRPARARARAATSSAQRRGAVVVHVERHLRAPAVREVAARSRARPAGRRRTRAARRRSRFASSTSSVARSTLKATSGGRAVTSTAPARRVERGRAVVGRELAGRDALGQPRAAPPARRCRALALRSGAVARSP